MCLAQGHNAVMLVRLEPAALQSRVKHSTTEPLRSHFCCCLLIFSKLTYSKNSFMNTIRVSKGLDPDQDRRSVCPDLDPNCLQRL